MTKKTFGIILISVVLSAFLYLQVIVIRRVLKQPEDLTEVKGIVEDVRKIKIPRKYAGYNYAFGLKISGSSLEFAIHEKHDQAFNYIKNNRIKNNRISLLYDSEEFNNSSNLTYHVYSLQIGNSNLLNIEDSKQTDKIGLLMMGIFDLLFIVIVFYFRNKKELGTT